MRRYNRTVPKRSAKDATLTAVGVRLQWLRVALGHTQAEWARELRISNQQLNKWEAGTRLPNIDALITICDASGASMDYLFRGLLTPEMEPELLQVLFDAHGSELILRLRPSRPLGDPSPEAPERRKRPSGGAAIQRHRKNS
jgi:transcriptional regulator with XRE-family HTH domain